MVKVSVIGVGHLGSIHAKLWKQSDYAQLAGIYDVDRDRADKLAEELDCLSFNSIEDAIENSDAVTIAVPTTEHYKTAKLCLEMGKHCLIEKPITSTYLEGIELINLSKGKNLLIQVGHVERFNPAIAAISSYEINPLFIESHRLSQFRPRAIDVSVIHDLMIHDIDIILWLVKSKVTKIDANGVAVLTDTIDIANARLSFENGCVANITASRISASPMRKMRIFQRDAYISIDFGKQSVDVYRIKDDNEEITDSSVPTTMLGSIELGIKNKNIYFEKPIVPQLNAIAEEQKAFAKAVMNNSEVPVGATEAAEALRIAEEISNQINIR